MNYLRYGLIWLSIATGYLGYAVGWDNFWSLLPHEVLFGLMCTFTPFMVMMLHHASNPNVKTPTTDRFGLPDSDSVVPMPDVKTPKSETTDVPVENLVDGVQKLIKEKK